MRRLLLLFFVALLPFQSAYAVAANYCDHEQGKAAQHFGHHQHNHVDADGTKSGDKNRPLGADLDCPLHHLTAAAAVPADPPALIAFVMSVFPAPDRPDFSSLPSLRPEKPNWSPAV